MIVISMDSDRPAFELLQEPASALALVMSQHVAGNDSSKTEVPVEKSCDLDWACRRGVEGHVGIKHLQPLESTRAIIGFISIQ